ncbi:MAG: radical SAM protein [Anaerolineaceae bacterium]
MHENTNNIIWKIGWGFTAACNMACPFCYSRFARQQASEVPLSIAKQFIEKNAADIECINYGTGESTLSPAWFQLIAYIRTHFPRIRQALTTNGTLATARRSSGQSHDWAENIDEIDVSIDFADAGRHNQMRGHPQAYAWALHTLDLCEENGITPTIVMVGFADTLTPENLYAILNLANEHHAFLRMNILRPTRMVSMAAPSIQTVFSGITWLLQNAKVVSLSDPLFGALLDPQFQKLEATGISSLRILPDGSITPSTYLITEDWKGDTIYNPDMRLNLLAGSPSFSRIQQAAIPVECEKCEHAEVCRGGAVDRRVLHFETLTRGDPYCPYLQHFAIPEKPTLQYYDGSKSSPTIHDGYLPTLIFAP